MLDSSEYQALVNGSERVLFCPGIPGAAGKQSSPLWLSVVYRIDSSMVLMSESPFYIATTRPRNNKL